MKTADQSSTKVVYAAIVANGGIAVAKFFAAVFTGSSAMLSEGIHSLVDTANEALLLLGQRRSEQPSTPAHPFGHGKELYFWSLIVAVLLFGIGGGMAFYEGVVHLMRPEPVREPAWSYAVLGIAAALEGGSFLVAYREIGASEDRGDFVGWWRRVRRSKDPSVFSIFAEDFAALLGVAVAATGVTLSLLFDEPWFDGAASMVIGAILAVVAVLLARESRGLLVGESATPEMLERILEAASGPQVVALSTPRTMHLGPQQLLVNLDVELAAHLTTREAAAALERMETRIRECLPEAEIVSLHLKAAVETGPIGPDHL
jgi:cation diffusion facilitator family transporter